MSARRAAIAGGVALALLLSAGACKDEAAGESPAVARAESPAATSAGSPAASLPLAEDVVYTCELAIVNRDRTPFGQAAAWAPEAAAARARAVPEACRRAGGGGACGAEEEGWKTTTSCVRSVDHSPQGDGTPGWSCEATAAKDGVTHVEAESPKSKEAACELALTAACQVAEGGAACVAGEEGWQVFYRVRGKKMSTAE